MTLGEGIFYSVVFVGTCIVTIALGGVLIGLWVKRAEKRREVGRHE